DSHRPGRNANGEALAAIADKSGSHAHGLVLTTIRFLRIRETPLAHPLVDDGLVLASRVDASRGENAAVVVETGLRPVGIDRTLAVFQHRTRSIRQWTD